MALHLRSDPQKLLAILVGDRLVGTAIPMYATFLTLNTYGADRTFFDDTIAVVVGLLTFVLLVSVDVVPKTLAAKFAVHGTEHGLSGLRSAVGSQTDLGTHGAVYSSTDRRKGLTLPLVTEEAEVIWTRAAKQAPSRSKRSR